MTMELLKVGVLTISLCLFATVAVDGRSSSLLRRLVDTDDVTNRQFRHVISKRQVPWCATCGLATKREEKYEIIPNPAGEVPSGPLKVSKNKSIPIHDGKVPSGSLKVSKNKSIPIPDGEVPSGSLKVSKKKSILSDPRCKDAPNAAVCKLLKNSIGRICG